MRSFTPSRLAGFTGLAVLGVGVAFATADSLTLIESRTVEPHGEVSPPLEDVTDQPGIAEHEELGARASAPDRRAGKKRSDDDKRRGEAGDDDDQPEEVVAAAFVPAGGADGGLPLPCSDTNSCVDRVGKLITDVRDRVLDLPTMRECTSSIGGEATCFDFGSGNYLVGDDPTDGEGEFGFCTDSGYYYVSGPSLEGGAGVACPGERNRGNRTEGRRCADRARVHELDRRRGEVLRLRRRQLHRQRFAGRR